MKSSPFRRQRGSLLIVAMIMSAIIAVSIASYINVGRSSLTMANRSLYNNGSMNLAENGLEEAMYSINRLVADSSYSFTADGWTAVGTSDMRRKWTGTTFDQNATGEVRVYVYNYAGTPRVIARSIVRLGGAATNTIEKWIEVRLAKTSKFANGLVAKDSISFSGTNASVDSWNSDPDNSSATAPVQYSTAVDNDRGSVGSISVSVSAVLVNNADIWGFAATGGALPSVGPNGRVGPFGQANGTMDMSRVSTDFSASFDAVTVPSTSGYNLGGITTATSLPRIGDLPAADGKFYYDATQINFNNQTFEVRRRPADTSSPQVVVRLSNTTTSISIGGGSGALNVESNAKLEIYAPGDISISGQGIMNGGTTAGTSNQPINLQIWGTKTSGVQDIRIAGNGALSAVLYAPQGSVKINGNGDVMGSVVANDITVVGNAAFHYDESLGNFGGNNPFRVSRWNEITSQTDRAALAAVMTF